MKYIRRTSKEIKEDFVKELLYDRGIITQDTEFQNAFFNPTKENEIDPSLFENIDAGYHMLMEHLRAGHQIYLPIDCDCDGYTSAALFYLYLTEHFKEYNPEIIYHVPDGKEHGLKTLLDWFPEDGTDKLIVVPDAGSNDIDECKILSERGYELLIVDHHLISQPNPYAVVINNQGSPRYDNKALSGVGVVYKFFEYIENQKGMPPYSADYLDLVMLGID